MYTKNKASELKKKFLSKDIIRIVGAHDGLGAKLISEANFDGVWASGLEISASHGLPDANILTMTEYLERSSEMNEASNLPVIADCDTGYGNVNNVIYLVEKYEQKGIAGICIEDKLFPKTNSFIEGRQDLASVEEFSGKIRAAKNTQKNKDFMVIARIEALIAGWGMEEALHRAKKYVEAGADAILIHSKKKDPKEIITFCKKFKNKVPVVVVPTTYIYFSEKQMKSLGIKMVIYANHILRTTIKSVSENLSLLRSKGQLSCIENKISPLKKVFDLQGQDILKDNEKNYLPIKNSNIKVVVPAAGGPPIPSQILRNRKVDDFIYSNYPIALLKINEKSILERIIESCKKLDLNNIEVITGYKSERFKGIKNVKLIQNKKFKNTSQLESIKLSLKKNTEIVVIFADIIFEPEILQRLISSDSDVTLAINIKSNETSDFADMALVEDKFAKEGRVLTLHRKHKIKKVAKRSSINNFNFEFIGISYFSKKAVNELIKILGKKRNIDFNDAINFLIKKNLNVTGLEVSSGWSEIRNKDQFKFANNFFK